MSMKGSYISFCNTKAFNIIDESFKERVLKNLKDNFYVTIKDRNFYIINKKNIKYIEKNPHIISVKSLGSLYYLYLCCIDDIKYCLYIDKRIKDGHKYPRIISCIYRFEDELFNNTLFDGELLRNEDDNWLYIINNIILHKGELLKNKNIMNKLNIVYDILGNHYKKDDHLEICPLYVKRLFSYHEWDYVVKQYIPSLKFKCRGIYFEGIRNLNNHLYLFPRNQKFNKLSTEEGKVIKETIEKVKEVKKQDNKKMINSKVNIEELRSKDFMNFVLRKTDTSDIYNLYCYDNDEIRKYGIALIDTLKTSKKTNKYFKGGKDSVNVKCEYQADKEKWIPRDITEDNIDNLDTISEFIRFKFNSE